MKNMFGRAAYIAAGVVDVKNIRNIKMRVEYDDGVIEGKFVFGTVSNSLSVGGFIKLPDDQVKFNDGKFEVSLIRHPKTPAELEEIIRTLTLRTYYENDGVPSPMVRFFRTDRIVFKPKTEMTWTLDGEFGGTPESVEIVNHHGAIELLRHL